MNDTILLEMNFTLRLRRPSLSVTDESHSETTAWLPHRIPPDSYHTYKEYTLNSRGVLLAGFSRDPIQTCYQVSIASMLACYVGSEWTRG